MSVFDQELPFLSSRRFHGLLVIACPVFLFLFLLVFLPFGVNEPKRPINLRFALELSLFGWMVFFTLLAGELLLRRRLRIRWTFGAFLWWVAWMVFSSGSTNFLLYNYLQSWYDMHWESYVRHVVSIGLVEFFPIAGVFLYFRQRLLSQRLATLQQGETVLDLLKTPVTFTGSSEREQLTIEVRQLLFIEASDNYVVIHYRDDGRPRKHILRSTLSSLEAADYPVDCMLRIHRSYLVNRYAVETLRGNVQKSELKLRHLDRYFPVSRGYVHTVRERISTVD